MANNITTVPYHYDKQFRRYIQQFMRLFSGFQFLISTDNDGNPIYQTVPVRYGDTSRMANHILKQNSENKVLTVPMISCYITNLAQDSEWRTFPQHEDKTTVYEKKFNDETKEYENEVGDSYTVTRHQPVPYRLQMNCDIWTSNTEQKLQILEQILVLFNPSVNIHTNNNSLDWSTLSYVELMQVLWTNRAIPQGVDDIIDIASLQFQMPILVNPPAKVQKNTLIQTIINNIHAVDTGTADDFSVDDLSNVNYATYQIITLGNYKMRIVTDNADNTTAEILNSAGGSTDDTGNPLTWSHVLANYGEFRPNLSQIRLRKTTDPGDISTDIIGTLDTHLTNGALLNVTIDTDTLPGNTQDPITTIVDPQNSTDWAVITGAAVAGSRYLLLGDIPVGQAGYPAVTNDIVEYNGATWSTTFDASTNSESVHYTTNLTTLDKLKWTGEQWINAYEGTYNAGYWRVYL